MPRRHGTNGRSSRYSSSRIEKRRLGIGERLKEGKNGHCIDIRKERLVPTATQREADVLAFKLFCLFAFLLVGLITAGVL